MLVKCKVDPNIKNDIEEVKGLLKSVTDQLYEASQRNENIDKVLDKVVEFLKVDDSIGVQYKDLTGRVESQLEDLEYLVSKQNDLIDKCAELQDNYFKIYSTFLAMQNSIRIMKATVDQHKDKGCGLEGSIGDYPTYISDFLETILKIGEDL